MGGGGQELRQWQVGQVGGVNTGGHMTSPGGGDQSSHGSHTHSRYSLPTTPLTSIPCKKHSDNNKPINIAVYSAPLTSHSEEKSPEHEQIYPL